MSATITEGLIDLDPQTQDSSTPAFTKEEAIALVQEWVADDDPSQTQEAMVERLMEIDPWRVAECDLPSSGISKAEFAEIVRTHALNAPKTAMKIGGIADAVVPSATHPPELQPLIDSGDCIQTQYTNGRPNHWEVKKCSVCGNFNKDECCGQPTKWVWAESLGNLIAAGRQALGLEPIQRPKTPEDKEKSRIQSWKDALWWSSFSGVDEMESGGIKMYVENIIPEGVTIISSLPKEGKTWLALSLCKALTSGQPLFGQAGFEVPEPVPVIYLAAEVGDRAFKQRIQKFGITNDKTRFLCRTLTKGGMNLEDTNLEQAIRALQPIVILDVLSCFSQSDDEDNSVENQKLRRMIGGLRRAGARAVIILHHSTKNFKQKPTKENAVRGSGDILAMVDCVWALMLDDRLYQSSQVEEVDVIGWGRDFSPSPFRFALTRRGVPSDGNMYKNGVVSVIDSTHDLGLIDKAARVHAAETASQDVVDTLERMVQDNSKLSSRKLAELTGRSRWVVETALSSKGWVKGQGRYGTWKKTETKTEMVQ